MNKTIERAYLNSYMLLVGKTTYEELSAEGGFVLSVLKLKSRNDDRSGNI
jgi:hypothetical protein